MFSDWRFWLPALLALVALALTGINTGLRQATFRASEQFAERQAYITQSQQLSQVNQALIQALANVAARVNDRELRALLEKQGISYTVTTSTVSEPTSGDGDE